MDNPVTCLNCKTVKWCELLDEMFPVCESCYPGTANEANRMMDKLVSRYGARVYTTSDNWPDEWMLTDEQWQAKLTAEDELFEKAAEAAEVTNG